MEREDFAACPLCKQYSHSIGDDQLAAAFNHFQLMYSHRGDGIPTQHCFDEQTRDAAQALMAAATRPTADLGEDGELVERMGEQIREWGADEQRGDWWAYQREYAKARDRLILYREALESFAANFGEPIRSEARAVLSRSGDGQPPPC